MTQKLWNDVQIGDIVGPLAFPLSVYRLVVAAASNRDFNSIHHNSEYAKASGAPEMYANTTFLQGMWERALRGYMGLGGTLRKISGFRMNSFNCAGETVVVKGEVVRVWREGDTGYAEVKMWSENGDRISVGPGLALITLPTAVEAA
jgi:acyl dehydratase